MTFVQPLAVFADVNNSPFAVNPDYLISSGSNANLYGLMTLELGDDDYGVAPTSSIQSVTNTIDFSDAAFWVYQMDLASEKAESFSIPLDSNGFARYDVPSGKSVLRAGIRFGKKSLPPSGTYDLQISYSSDFSYSYNRFQFWSRKKIDNASVLDDYFTATSFSQQLSGDVYFNMVIGLNSITNATYYWYYDKAVSSGKTIAGYFDVNFSKSSDEPDYTTVGSGMSDASYNEGMTDAVGNISSSIGDMSESLDSAAENLEYISTSQNLIIQGIDNVIMHISDQLYAFWDQLYNLIHEPTYARLGDILDAIRNLDLEITVEMTEVTNAVNKMNQEVQNKLQQTTDKITGGYDSSVLESENQQIQSAVDEYDQSEQAILDSVEGNIEDFTYPSFDDLPLGVLGALGFFGGFMQSVFENMGSFNMIITFSLTLIFVLILIGYHRIRT